MAESKRKTTSKSAKATGSTKSGGFHKGDQIVTNGVYDAFPKGTHGRVLDVDEENQILSVQLEGDPGKDTEAAVMEHPFSFFEKEKTHGKSKSGKKAA